MPLETASFVSQLVETNPSQTDDISQGDNHLRLIKAVLKATFPNLNAAVTADPSEINKLDGVTVTTAEINRLTGVTDNIVTLIAAAKAEATVPVGTTLPYAGKTAAPTGFLFCNGQAVSRTTYASLFAVIGTDYGAGDGSTTFNVPNLLGRHIEGTENPSTVGQFLPNDVKAHAHLVDVPGTNFVTDVQGNHTHNSATNAPFFVNQPSGIRGWDSGGFFDFSISRRDSFI